MLLLFRADAAFARPEVYEYLEGEGIGDAIRLPSNEVLGKQIEHLMEHSVEWPSRGPVVCYHDFTHQAQSWDRSRGGGQGRVEPRRTFRQSGLHPHQLQLSNEGDCQLL